MIKNVIDRIDNWYNGLHGDKQVYYFFAFCLIFTVIMGLGIYYIRFDPQPYRIVAPQHIGQPSGEQFTDSLYTKKH